MTDETKEYASNSGPDDKFLEQRQQIVDLEGWRNELRAIRFRFLFPFAEWWRDRPWTLIWVQFLVFAFCFPLTLIAYYEGKDIPLEEAAWAFSLYFAIVWAIVLHRCMSPGPVGRGRLISVGLFTCFLGAIAVGLIYAIGSIIPGVRDIMQQTEAASLVGRLVGFTLAVGLVEETVKAIPIVWIASRQPEPLKPLAIAYLGAISGLAFGAIEAVVYSLTYASDHAAASLSYGQYVVVQVLRFVSLPLLHGIWSATLGYFIGLAFCARASKRVLLVFGLALVTIMHGLYDTFAGGWLGLLVAMASLLLFVGYVRSQHFILSGLLQSSVTPLAETEGGVASEHTIG